MNCVIIPRGSVVSVLLTSDLSLVDNKHSTVTINAKEKAKRGFHWLKDNIKYICSLCTLYTCDKEILYPRSTSSILYAKFLHYFVSDDR